MKSPLNVFARAGETIRLEGDVTDPDRDRVTVKWWKHPAGSCAGDVTFAQSSSAVTQLRIPPDALPGQTIHLILEATDNGSRPLTRYQRVIVTGNGK